MSSAPKNILLTVEISDAHAAALAQFLKRIGWTEIRACAVDDDEAHLIRAALAQLREELDNEGYSPR